MRSLPLDNTSASFGTPTTSSRTWAPAYEGGYLAVDWARTSVAFTSFVQYWARLASSLAFLLDNSASRLAATVAGLVASSPRFELTDFAILRAKFVVAFLGLDEVVAGGTSLKSFLEDDPLALLDTATTRFVALTPFSEL
jgi:hypothetical protein